MATLPYALVTLDMVKARLGLSGSTFDTVLEELIDEMTVKIESECDRRFFDDAAVTEIHDGDYDDTGRNKIFTNRWPINSVTSISYATGGYLNPIWNILDGETQYQIDAQSGIIHTQLTNGRNSIRIIYRGGYTTIPHDIRHACIKEVSKAFQRRNSEGAKSESVAGTTVAWNEELDPTTKAICARYKRFEF